MDVSARFADSKKVTELKKKNRKSIAHEFGEVILPDIPIQTTNTVTLGLSRFFKVITVTGISPV